VTAARTRLARVTAGGWALEKYIDRVLLNVISGLYRAVVISPVLRDCNGVRGLTFAAHFVVGRDEGDRVIFTVRVDRVSVGAGVCKG